MNSTLPAGVWLLGGVSLLNDVASEAIYPLLPFFLTSVLGATAMSLGLIEGAAEAVSGILKVVSGRLSDRWGRRKPILLAGHSLSGLARPFISIASGWTGVFVLRFIDRVGKGIRSAPRDAMLADLADATNRGKVFGFHRAMDHTDAVLGPLLATAFLIAFPDRYRMLFALTAIPGIGTVVLLMWLKERPHAHAPLILNPQSLIPIARFHHLSSDTSSFCPSSRWATRRMRSCCCGSRTLRAARSTSRCCGHCCTSSRWRHRSSAGRHRIAWGAGR